MKVENYQIPKSSFLSMEKDLGLIVNQFLKNERLKKLLYYPVADCMSRPDLTEEETLSLVGKQIKIIPKITVDNEVKTYIVLNFDNFITNAENPEFRDNVIEIDIICHFDTWHLKDFELRPYKIAGEIDFMLNDKKLTGIGHTEFMGASQLILNDEFAGVCLMYQAIHGEEDKKGQPNPMNEADFIEEFNKTYNK